MNNPGNDGNVENSGRGRRKRAPRQIGALSGCLCGIVVDPSANLGDTIQCRQAACETCWVGFIFPYNVCNCGLTCRTVSPSVSGA